MAFEVQGKIVKGLGGLYEVRAQENGSAKRYVCRAKGVLKRDEEKLYIGDNVTVFVDEDTPDGIVISRLYERKNSLIRPPLSNVDFLFIVFAPKKPAPQLETIDKLIAIAEYNSIEPIIIITKSDYSDKEARELKDIYNSAGFNTFVTSSVNGEGLMEVKKYIDKTVVNGKTAAFAGASGVGKSTLMNALFPNLALATGEVSRKIERGKHTTRHVEIFDISDDALTTGFLADTPGFSLIDFERFDFFSLDNLEYTFRDLREYRGKCRYADCTHTGEGKDDCAIARAVADGLVSQSRVDSYRAIYKVLKAKSNKY